MTDVMTKKQRSHCMSKIKGRDTKIEIMFRKHLWSLGLKGYRVKSKIYGKPDFIFPVEKIAVFCDGCFWHKCPKHNTKPKSNKRFWLTKMQNNVKRDKEVNKRLKNEGWTVVRFWEHDLENNLDGCTKRLSKLIDIGKRGIQ
jgi:DNA mismatch endonuclease, patch repair protein